MKAIQTKNRFNKKIVYLAVGIILLLAVGSTIYVYSLHGNILGWSADSSSSPSYPNNNPPTKDQSQAGTSQKEDIVNQDRAAQGKPPIPGTDSSTTPSQTNSATLGVTITAANQNGSTVNIRSLVETVTSDGTCTLTLTKDGTTVTRTAGIQPLANASTCKGFDIPVSSLGKGAWNIQLSVTSGSKTGAASSSVVVN